ncbi:MAG: M23 family metallopeptidase [Verrucomicrobiae bacterium]|nr:M23 family metallopeptidase [Verrucomicrobiae bacterium]
MRRPTALFLGTLAALGFAPHAAPARSPLLHVFAQFPSAGLAQPPCFPTPNTKLFDDETEGYAAQTRTNPAYGMPGWSRSQGGRFHKGVDILPVEFERTERTVKIEYYDPKTSRSFSKNEPVCIPHDEIYAVLDGTVVVVNARSERSGYGRYVMIEHRFDDGTPFLSMYAHLSRVEVKEGRSVRRGDRLGIMGQTSSQPGGRRYLSAIPHCHFEVGRVIDENFASTRAARALRPPMLGGKYDPRNIQPYDPIRFLREFRAQPRSSLVLTKAASPQPREP